MKQLAALFAVLLLLLTITACSSDTVEPTNEQSVQPSEKTNSETSDNAPSNEQLSNDLRDSLTAWREDNAWYPLDFCECEIIKSLTNEKTYTAQIEVIAQSQYAEHKISADVAYTLYDQGWSMDSCNWAMIEYEVNRYPTEDEIDSLPYENGAIDLINIALEPKDVLFSVTGTQICNWSPYANAEENLTIRWYYDPTCDYWAYLETIENASRYTMTTAFENAWKDSCSRDYISITNVTETGFDFQYDGYNVNIDNLHVETTGGYIMPEYNRMGIFATVEDVTYYNESTKSEVTDDLQIKFDIYKDPQQDDEGTYDMMCVITIGKYYDWALHLVDAE